MRRKCWLPSRYVLVIAEKPKAAKRIAEYLAISSRPIYCSMSNVPFWILKRQNDYYIVASAAGHLYGLTTDETGFPVFRYYWAPLWQIDQNAKYTKKFLNVLELLSKKAIAFINACDYDIEGSVIGFLIIKFLGDLRRAFRVKFSALTPSDIRRAFSSMSSLDWDMIEAGLARHELDWLWGINVSRALMESVKLVYGKRVILSAGRVQSPTLKEAVDRTRRRNLFVPLPYFTVHVHVKLRNNVVRRILVATVNTRSEAIEIARDIKERPEALITNVSATRSTLSPPPPFNLGDLQAEAARIYGYDPHYTQSIAEQLYLEGLISYPRTNSQKIPPSIDIISILRGLAGIEAYSELVEKILSTTKGNPRPRNGVKDDPAHPAIHPTGLRPRKLNKPEQRIYDLIVRRFLASMMKGAVVSKISVTLLIANKYRVEIKGGHLEEQGWLAAYPFLAPKLDPLPLLRRGDKLRVDRVEVRTALQRAPEAHTKLSLVKWMEANRIGTEATRARIVKLLFDRGYLAEHRRRVYATDIGIAVAEILEKYFPQLVSVELTRRFEQMLLDIRTGRTRRASVVGEAKRFLENLLHEFKKSSMRSVGVELAKALGLMRPSKPCLICGREAYQHGLCKHHYDAYNELLSAYREWVHRMGNISFNSYVEKVSRSSATGLWVKDVAKAIMAGRIEPKLI